jgi:hypothetical protein
MSTKLEQARTPPAGPRKDTERETREAVVKTGVDDRDLVHGEGGTLGLGEDEDLNRDD